MAELGSFALLLGLFLSIYAILVDALGDWRKDNALIKSGRNATIIGRDGPAHSSNRPPPAAARGRHRESNLEDPGSGRLDDAGADVVLHHPIRRLRLHLEWAA